MNSLLSLRNIAVAAALAALTGFTTTSSAQDTVAKAKPVTTTKARPLSIAVDLINGTNIAGTLTDAVSLEMRTSFGSASIPLSEVAGIRFASADNASTTVVMLNGDSITGATDVKLVTVETEWGTASINGQNISSLLFVPGLAWNPAEGLNGKRWSLISKKEVSSASKTASTSTAPAASSKTPASSSPLLLIAAIQAATERCQAACTAAAKYLRSSFDTSSPSLESNSIRAIFYSHQPIGHVNCPPASQPQQSVFGPFAFASTV